MPCGGVTAARLVTKKRKKAHITSILADLHWLPVEFLLIYKTLEYTHLALRGLAPEQELINIRKINQTLRSDGSLLLNLSRVST